MYRIVPVSFYLDFANKEATEEELKHFVQFYWECLNHQSLNIPSTISGRDSKIFGSKNSTLGQTRQKISSIDDQLEVNLQSPKKNKKDAKSINIRGGKNRNETNTPDMGKKKE